MTKTKRRNKVNNLTEILPMHVIHEFLNCTYKERKTKIREASEFIKQKNIFGY